VVCHACSVCVAQLLGCLAALQTMMLATLH